MISDFHRIRSENWKINVWHSSDMNKKFTDPPISIENYTICYNKNCSGVIETVTIPKGVQFRLVHLARYLLSVVSSIVSNEIVYSNHTDNTILALYPFDPTRINSYLFIMHAFGCCVLCTGTMTCIGHWVACINKLIAAITQLFSNSTDRTL